MKNHVTVAALAAASVLLCGCTSVGMAAVGELPTYEVRKKPPVRCSDVVSRINEADGSQVLTPAQQQAVYRACEDSQAGTEVKPEAVRRTIGSLSPL